MYSMLPSVNVENYTSLLPIVIHFVSMVLLLLLRSKEWCWIRIDKNGHICFIAEFCGTTLSFSSRTVMLLIYLSYIAFTMLHYFLLLRISPGLWYWMNFVTGPFFICWTDMWISSLSLTVISSKLHVFPLKVKVSLKNPINSQILINELPTQKWKTHEEIKKHYSFNSY